MLASKGGVRSYYEVISGLCVPDRPTLSCDFLRFRLGLLRPTDPPREARRWAKMTFLGRNPVRPPLFCPQGAGRELFLSLLSRFVPFSSDFDPDRPTRRAQRAARFFEVGKQTPSDRPTSARPLGAESTYNFTPPRSRCKQHLRPSE